MKVKLLMGLLVVGAIPLVFSSCNDDDEPKKAGITFEKATEETFESDGTLISFHPDFYNGGKGHDIVVKLVLDRALPETAVIKYSLTGTASSENPADDVMANDYSVKEGVNTIVGSDKITIEKGATEATIRVTVYEDLIVANEEFDDVELETVVLKLESVESGPAVLGESVTYTLSIKEDDSVIILTWMDGETELVGDIDMDLFLWSEGELFDASNSPNDPENPEESYEALLLYGAYPESEYGLSYTYYQGTSDNVEFYALMRGYFNGEFYNYAPATAEEMLVYGGVYTLANLNPYDETEIEPAVVQTMVKNDFDYETSDITVPDAGSRSVSPLNQGTSKLSLKEIKQVKQEQLRSFLTKRTIDRKSFNKPTLEK